MSEEAAEALESEDLQQEEQPPSHNYDGIKEEFHEHIDLELFGQDEKYRQALEEGWDPTKDTTNPNYSNYGAFLRNRDAFSKDKERSSQLEDMNKNINVLLQTVEEEKQQAVSAAIAELEAKRDVAIEDMDAKAASDLTAEIERQKASTVKASVPQQEHSVFRNFRIENPSFNRESDSYNEAATLALEAMVNNQIVEATGGKDVLLPDSVLNLIVNNAHEKVSASLSQTKKKRSPPKISTPAKEKVQVNYVSRLSNSQKTMYDSIIENAKDKESAKKRADAYAKNMVEGK